MAIRTLTYLDVPLSQRRASAAKALSRIREHLSDPMLTPDQEQKMREQMAKVQKWLDGSLPVKGT